MLNLAQSPASNISLPGVNQQQFNRNSSLHRHRRHTQQHKPRQQQTPKIVTSSSMKQTKSTKRTQPPPTTLPLKTSNSLSNLDSIFMQSELEKTSAPMPNKLDLESIETSGANHREITVPAASNTATSSHISNMVVTTPTSPSRYPTISSNKNSLNMDTSKRYMTCAVQNSADSVSFSTRRVTVGTTRVKPRRFTRYVLLISFLTAIFSLPFSVIKILYYYTFLFF